MFQTYTDLPVIANRKITKLAFRNRFISQEKAGIELAAIDNPNSEQQDRAFAAGVRAMLADQRDAEYIDLDRADARQSVLDLEAYGIIAAGRALEILDATVLPEEAFKG